MAGRIIVLTGPPGAGKSTTARSLAATFESAVHLHTDDFWHYIVTGGIPPYLADADAQNHTVMDVIAGAAGNYARGGYVVIVDGVVGPWMLHHFERGSGAGHRHPLLDYIVLRPSRAVTLERAQGRSAPDALVNEAPLVSMWEQFAHLGALESHVIDTSSQQPSDTLDAVVHGLSSGRYRISRATRLPG